MQILRMQFLLGKKGDSYLCGTHMEMYFRSCSVYLTGHSPGCQGWDLFAVSEHTAVSFVHHFPVFHRVATSFLPSNSFPLSNHPSPCYIAFCLCANIFVGYMKNGIAESKMNILNCSFQRRHSMYIFVHSE